MNAEPKQAKQIFLEAIDLPPGEWAGLLDRACAGQAELRRRVEALLEAHREAGTGGQPALPGASARSGDADLRGVVIGGRYKLIEQIGEGGMGTVWMAEQTEPVKRLVAIKLIKPGMDSKQVLARFEAERQALALMDHPHIAKVYDGGDTGAVVSGRWPVVSQAEPDAAAPATSHLPRAAASRPYFVMELVKGVPITRYCDECRLTPRQRLELFVPVCHAIQHAHQKGIIHRDLKPSNVLVALYDDKPAPKVIDFGVAKPTGQQLTEQTLHTGFGAVVGTVEYMSPEQASFNQLDVDTRSDIYSLGVLLYELLAGSPPFGRGELEKAGVLEMLRLIREEEPSKPSTKLSTAEGLGALAANRGTEPQRLAALVRGELDWIVMKSLEKDRSRRYETASSLALDLQRYLANEPVEACPPSAAYRARKFVQRHRAGVMASAVALVALVGGTVAAAWGLVEARRQRDTAEHERDDKDKARKEAEASAREAKRQEAQALTQRQEAEQQAAISQAVNDFLLKDLLGQADVGSQEVGDWSSGLEPAPRDRDIKVRTLLDRAARQIEGKFAGQPLTEAAVRHTLGRTYWALGEYAEAEGHLERSLAIRARILGAEHPLTLTSKTQLGLLYCSGHKEHERAERLLREVLDVRLKISAADHPLTLTNKNNLALIYHRQQKYDQAGLLYQEVLQARRDKLGGDHVDTLVSKHNLASLYRDRGDHERSEKMHQEVLQAHLARFGADHPLTASSKHELALVYRAQKRPELAEAFFQEALAWRGAKLGREHSLTQSSREGLAYLYWELGRYDRAAPLLLEAVEVARLRLAPGHPRTQRLMTRLIESYEHMGNQAEAARWRQELADQKRNGR